jgi:hypothetical protein
MIPVGILTAAATSSFSFLLDLYPGAAAAYSLRKLRAGYVGNCIRVQRSSDNTFTDISFVNNVIDLTTLQIFVGASTGYVTIWYDQSGNNNNAINAVGADSPRIIILGVLQTLNSLPCINFFNQVTYLNIGTPITVNTNLSVFMSAKGTSLASSGMMLGNIGAPTVFYGYLPSSLGSNVAFIGGLNAVNNLVTTSPNYANTNYLIFNCIVNSTNYYLYQNNNTFTQTVSGISPAQTTFLYLGKYFNFQSDAKTTEIIIYKTDQLSNRNGIINNTNTFYSIF